MNIILSLVISLNVVAFGQEQTPVITIPDGQLRGTTNLTFKENVTFYTYRGIPFAQKPLGDLRFAPPIKNDPWEGVLDATNDKSPCTQLFGGPTQSQEVIGSEDCLYINVYTTNLNGSLPVMVWIYGGGFNLGGSLYSIYGPDYFLEKNVIFVSFNYRLGTFGFLSTEDLIAPGNWGLKDQVLALKWVQQNIEYFGGDPKKVTVFGQSAGSASVAYLLQSPLTAGLYRGAIMQSASSLNGWTLTRNARHKAFSVGLKVGIFTLSSRTLIRNLRKVDYKTLALAEGNVTTIAYLTDNILAGLPFAVVSEPDHPGAVFSGKSWQQLSEGYFNHIPVIIGHTSRESAGLEAFIDRVRPILLLYDLDVTRLVPYDMTQNWFKRLIVGNEIKRYYFGSRPIADQPTNLTAFLTIDLFKRGIREAAILLSRYVEAYYYQFSYKGVLGDPNNTHTGVAHAEELAYLFVKRQPINEPDARTIQRFVTLWTNFAKTGNPTPSDGNGSVLGNLIWESNNPSTDANVTIKYLNINDTLTMRTNPFQEDWEFYQDLYNRYGDPPYGTY